MHKPTKSVLFITYYWPPAGGSGVQRPLKFVKYLREFGWEPIVVTSKDGEYMEMDHSLAKDVPQGLQVIPIVGFEPFAFYKKFIGVKPDYKLVAGYLHQKKAQNIREKLALWIRSNLFVPDARMLWIWPAYRKLRQVLKTQPVDAIVSTGPPHSMHLLAMWLKKSKGLPWIADFRDPWTDIDYYQDLKLSAWTDRLHHRLERRVLQKADRVVCVSPSWGEGLARKGGRTIDYIYNGFDPEDFEINTEVALDAKFTIVHIGMMGKSRNHEMFWDAVRRLIDQDPQFAQDVQIKIVGKWDPSVEASIARTQLQDYTQLVGYLPHDAVVHVQRSAQVLYLSVNDTANAKGILTGKIYEYLAVKRPILCIGPSDGEAAKVILSSGAGTVAPFGNVDMLTSQLAGWYKAYKSGRPFTGGADIDIFSRKAQTGQLAHLLDALVLT